MTNIEKRLDIQRKKLFTASIRKQLPTQRPKLNKIHYTEDGRAIIANSIALVAVKDVHDGTKHVPDPEYPDIEPVLKLPSLPYKAIQIPTEKIEKSLKSIAISNDYAIMNVSVKDNQFTIQPYYENEFKPIHLSLNEHMPLPINFHIMPRLFHDALNFFRMLDIPNVLMVYKEPNKPIHFIHKNIHYVISPIRVN